MVYSRRNIQFDVMFGATKQVVEQARELRQNMTEGIRPTNPILLH
jgi:hypothetical protein